MLWLALGEYRGPALMSAFVGYATSRWAMHSEQRIWMGYVADSLRLTPQMMYIPDRFAEIMGWIKHEPDRTAEEIIDDVIARMTDEPT